MKCVYRIRLERLFFLPKKNSYMPWTCFTKNVKCLVNSTPYLLPSRCIYQPENCNYSIALLKSLHTVGICGHSHRVGQEYFVLANK